MGKSKNKNKEISRSFTDEDKVILSQDVPIEPCISCPRGSISNCSGCPSYTSWENSIKKYKDRGLFEYALILTKIRRKKKMVSNIKDEIEKMVDSLPEEIRNL